MSRPTASMLTTSNADPVRAHPRFRAAQRGATRQSMRACVACGMTCCRSIRFPVVDCREFCNLFTDSSTMEKRIMTDKEDDNFDINQIERDLWRAEQVNQARARVQQRARRAESKDNVVACRLDNETLAAVDTLVEAGVRANRADAAAWLIGVGLEAHRDL